MMSGSAGDIKKVEGHKKERTQAMVSEKVGKGLEYQAAERTGKE
jgi:hypothetical protein